MDIRDPQLVFTFPGDLAPGFSQLLQRGVLVGARQGSSVRGFLHGRLGLDTEYIEREISTIFLDGKPVDDIDATALADGSTLALSAAMPGLVGATMRRGGYYARLRSDISYKETKQQLTDAEVSITLKLFNLVATTLGPMLLENGVRVRWDALEDFLRSRPAAFWERCQAKSSDGSILSRDDLLGVRWDEPWICLAIHVRDKD